MRSEELLPMLDNSSLSNRTPPNGKTKSFPLLGKDFSFSRSADLLLRSRSLDALTPFWLRLGAGSLNSYLLIPPSWKGSPQ